ncbi:MAG: cyclopropane-fatty-acyl-phospholipid synthase family protein [Bacteroidota bacterium]
MNALSLVEKNLVPDFLIRSGIRKLLKQRLRDESTGNEETQQEKYNDLIDFLKGSPIAVNTADANEQHYEVPTAFYLRCLGKNLKYSSCYYPTGTETLDQAEDIMLALTCERAELTNGLDVLELGCGWGSLSLYMSAKFPGSNFTVVSNSRTQKEHIDEQAKKRGIRNLTVITADMNVFNIDKKFDRVVSVEMFEHMRNYEKLFARVAGWMKDDAKCFVHIFTHKTNPYLFEVKDESDWMSRYFFSGGIMPNNHLYYSFNDHIKIDRHWVVNGQHYERTANHWLENMDAHKKELMPLFEQTYGKDKANLWWAYWRIFYMACAELWGYNGGNEWMVCHYQFSKVSAN